MKRQRKNKVIIIIALIVSVVGMGIGFAVFSDVLTISSSATVTPNEDDFKLTIYGVISEEELKSIDQGNSPDLTKWSTTTAYQDSDTLGFANDNSSSAIINNSNFTISNVSANFTSPGNSAVYVFLVKNEGSYNAHVKFSEATLASFNSYDTSKVCTPGLGTTTALVNDACKGIYSAPFMILNSAGENVYETFFTDSYEVLVGEYIIIWYLISYDSSAARADGPFTVQFPDIEFEFSTAA